MQSQSRALFGIHRQRLPAFALPTSCSRRPRTLRTHGPDHPRDGFTLLELLVSITVIGLLMGLALPSIQMVRESARRTECTNHLHQIAVAWANHEVTHRHFPSGGWGAQWVGDPDRGYNHRQPGGWAYDVLPYLEHKALRDLGKGLTGAPRVQAITECITIPLPEFYCPSRRSGTNYPSWKFYGHEPPYAAADVEQIAKTDYAACAGDQTDVDLPYPDTLAVGDSSFAWSDSSGFTGVCFQRSEIRTADLEDGSSHIFLVGEKSLSRAAYAGAYSNGDHHGVYAGSVIDSLRSANAEYLPVADPQDVDLFRRFGSAHSGGLNMSFCDGTVRRIAYTMDATIFSRLGNRHDGQPASAP